MQEDDLTLNSKWCFSLGNVGGEWGGEEYVEGNSVVSLIFTFLK